MHDGQRREGTAIPPAAVLRNSVALFGWPLSVKSYRCARVVRIIQHISSLTECGTGNVC
jgi:hypothetical protein